MFTPRSQAPCKKGSPAPLVQPDWTPILSVKQEMLVRNSDFKHPKSCTQRLPEFTRSDERIRKQVLALGWHQVRDAICRA